MSWGVIAGSAISAVAGGIAANQQKKATQGAAGAAANNQLNPAQIGLQALQAQQNLAPTAINLNNQYGGQFTNSNNSALNQALFGAQTPTDLLSKDENFSRLTPEMQQYLSAQAAQGGLQALNQRLQAGNPYTNLLGLYQGMTGNQVGAPEQNDAFNQWTLDQGFEGWGQGEGLSSTLGKWSNDVVNAPAPGMAEILGNLDSQLNPGYAGALSKLGAAADQAPATISAQQVGLGPNASAFQNALGSSVTPQVNTQTGKNAGVDSLQGLLSQGTFQNVSAPQINAQPRENFAGPVAQVSDPSPLTAQQAKGSQVAPAAQSAAPQQVQAPTSFERVQGTSINGPAAPQQVQAPGAVANVQAPTSFERVNAPNVGLSQITTGQNQTLNNLQSQGFNANRPIQQTLEQQAQGDLALGGQLSADQIRMAQQASRAAAGARGMVGSNGAMLDEIQRQLDRSGQLLNERRAFAQGVENQGFNQLAAQQQNAISTAGLQNQLLGLQQQGQQANNDNALALGQMGLQAGLANQAAGLEGNRLNLQGQVANQNAALSGQQMGLQAGLANQSAGLQAAQLGQQAQIANQDNALRAGLANQAAGQNLQQMGLQALLANQAANLNNSQFNAGQTNAQNQLAAQLGQQNSQFNAGQANDLAALWAQLMQQSGQFNAAAANQNSQFNAGQADTAAARALQAQQINAQLAQQAALANQAAGLQLYGQQLGAAGQLGALQNDQAAQSLQGQMANQNAFLQNRGQTLSGLQALMAAENQTNQFNATNNLAEQQFNANQQQQGFGNLLAYQQAMAQGRIDPLSTAQLALGQQNWGMFNPFDPAIMSMYAANAQNAANAQIAAGNNNAAINSGLIQGIGQLGAGALNAWSNYQNNRNTTTPIDLSNPVYGGGGG